MEEVVEAVKLAREAVNVGKAVGKEVSKLARKSRKKAPAKKPHASALRSQMAEVKRDFGARTSSIRNATNAASEPTGRDNLARKSENCRGVLVLDTINSGGSALPRGTILLNQLLSPFEFTNQALRTFGTLYEKFVFGQFRLDYTPSCGNQETGSLLAYYDPDPDNDPTTIPPDVLWEKARRHAQYLEKPVILPWTLAVDAKLFTSMKRGGDKVLYTDPASSDDRMCFQGRLVVIANAELGANKTFGTLTARWGCDFFMPKMDDTALNGVGRIEGATSMSATNPFGTASTWDQYSSFTFGYSLGAFTLREGTYLFSLYATGSDIGIPTAVGSAGVAVTDLMALADPSGAEASGLFKVAVSNPTGILTVGLPSATVVTVCVGYFTSMPPGMTEHHLPVQKLSVQKALTLIEERLRKLESEGRPVMDDRLETLLGSLKVKSK
jgi:hypothetical protein